ncbi:hypothetical protein [Pedobacter sp. Hv1]|uniref:hypothetical protein n=1 Tax=Pedobacter sp. Hv1 TaxID=1740090 RepID=UPI0006D8940E|nr:hypothetical protein [Pedobacter sp. Hv1]KQC02489.1 hypothetical protein AQF98_02610 [Pedobacter sp. Hv1]
MANFAKTLQTHIFFTKKTPAFYHYKAMLFKRISKNGKPQLSQMLIGSLSIRNNFKKMRTKRIKTLLSD